jgi:hypothetical protein
MWAYLKDMGWAQQDKEGTWSSVNCNLSELGPIVEYDNSDPENPIVTKNIAGWHFNLRLYGDAAAAMVSGKVQTEVKRIDGVDETVTKAYFDRTNLKTLAEAKMVRSQTLKADGVGGLPAGYEDSFHKVRVYPAENVSKRKNVWA